MKHIAQDFKDKLSGEPNKHDFVRCIKKTHESIGMKCRINRRKLAGGKRKIYFLIEIVCEYEERQITDMRKRSRRVIEEFFPDASITSSCRGSWTFSEY